MWFHDRPEFINIWCTTDPDRRYNYFRPKRVSYDSVMEAIVIRDGDDVRIYYPKRCITRMEIGPTVANNEEANNEKSI